MNWLNIRVHTLRSREIIAAPPAALGTWVRVLGYCCECENGGVISDAAGWNDRQWMTACGVTASEVAEAAPLLRKDGAAVVVALYPEDKQQEVQEKRAKASENGKKGGRPRKDEQGKPTLVNSEKPTLVSEQKPMSLAGRKAEREREREREVELEGESEGEVESESAHSSRKRHKFVSPSLDQWKEFARTLTPAFPDIESANAFYHYESNGWKVGSNPCKDWRACCRKCHGKWCSQSANPITGRSNGHKPRGGPCPGDPCPITPLREFNFENPGTIPGPPP